MDIVAAAGPVYDHGAYPVALQHVTVLLGQADTPGDRTLTAQLLLAGLGADLVLHQTRNQHIPLEQIADNWEAAARRLATW
ncbi:hypothetical protein AB4305_33695 [Nocardia sp. 2YAB30]|uniref:hypothetical protein n=1 Tax=unclassified Nocardia TaxID=2637762 RepID=UPI003F9DDA99